MATIGESLDAEYGWVALVLVIICAQVLLHGIPIGGLRRKLFGADSKMRKSPEFKALEEDHKKAFGGAIDKNGYPDMGNGRLSDLLEYKGA